MLETTLRGDTMHASTHSLCRNLPALCAAAFVALAALGMPAPAAKAAPHAQPAPGIKMYIIDGFRFYVRKHSQPGHLTVDLDVQQVPGAAISSYIILDQGDIPPRDGFHEAARRYLQSYAGNCTITDYYSQTDAEFRYTYRCR